MNDMPTYEELEEMGFYLSDEEIMNDLFSPDNLFAIDEIVDEEAFQALVDAANEALVFEKEPINVDYKEITDLDIIKDMFNRENVDAK